MILPIILAGGSGTRLWPLSRALYPKQLINLVDENTMLQNTVRRLDGLPDAAGPVVICNDEYRFMVAEQLRLINVPPSAIILEPVGRNTAPALAVAALMALNDGTDPVLLVLPADHHIQRADPFQQALVTGYEYARSGHLITFGIIPDQPEIGYGYIKMGRPLDSSGDDGAAMAIDAFVEKPDLETAKRYVDSKAYCWNSGMFMFSASRVIAELETFAPDIVAACRKAIEKGTKDLDFFRLDRAAFAASPSDSIDYAVMEKTRAGAMVPMAAGWNDLGSWEALWQVGEKDDSDNVIKGDVVVHDVSDSYLHAENRLIAAVGLKDHIVVETPDAVMISPRHRVQDVKGLVDRLKAHSRIETHTHKRVYRPWGTVDQLVVGSRFQVNRLTVKPGGALSLQKHFNRSEHWVVVRGVALVTKREEQIVLREDYSIYISAGTPHRLENPGKIALEVIEVQTGAYIGEDDITRLEDNYGRNKSDACPLMNVQPPELEDLRIAKTLLENPGLAAKITHLLGTPIEKGFTMLPDGWKEKIGVVTRTALSKAIHAAVMTMGDRPGRPASTVRHTLAAAASGAMGGFFGLPALVIELPISTTFMLRSIADIARSESEPINTAESKIACVEVFTLGGPTAGDNATESGYYAVRTALAQSVTNAAEYIAHKGVTEKGAPALVRLIVQIAQRFSVQVSEKAAAQAIPVIGAAGGAMINTIFIDHFQAMARGHFIVRRLERTYGKAMVEEAYKTL